MLNKIRKYVKEFADANFQQISWHLKLKEFDKEGQLAFIKQIKFINKRDMGGQTLLSIAINDFPDLVEPVIQAGAKVNLKDASGIYPIFWAIQLNKPEILKLLIDAGANLNLLGTNKRTTLMYAIENTQCFDLLIQAKVDLNKIDAEGRSILNLAIVKKNLDMVTELVENGANINYLDPLQYTPIMLAILTKDLNIIKAILKYNPDMNFKNKFGETAYELAMGQPAISGIYDLVKIHQERSLLSTIPQETKPITLAKRQSIL